MRTDEMLVTTQGVQGKKKHTNLQGMVSIAVLKGFNEPENRITVDCFKGLGHSYQRRETALINITFADGKEWNGTFADLQKDLSH